MADYMMARKKQTDMPQALPIFSHINRYWDRQQESYVAKILPGEYYVSLSGEMIVTVLGSCVSACIRDKVVGVGGMNHFMLPDAGGGSQSPKINMQGSSEAARYGVHAMELLINEILKNGGHRQNLEVKITGGGRMLKNMSDIGKRNIDFVRDYLSTEGIPVIAEDVGDIYPRKVYYFSATGKVRVKKLRSMHNSTIAQRESEYLHGIDKQPVQSDIELF